jgi:hypothetical protein
MRIPLKERKAHLLNIPWITLVKKPHRCDGVKWSGMPLYALYNGVRNKTKEEQDARFDKQRCKKKGLYRLRALKRGRIYETKANSGEYCWSHLMNNLNYSPGERRRLDAWFEKNPPPWKKETTSDSSSARGNSAQEA